MQLYVLAVQRTVGRDKGIGAILWKATEMLSIPKFASAGTHTPGGWCRAELWCRLLSIRHDTKVIVLFSAKEALYILPYDWQRHLVADGLRTFALVSVCVLGLEGQNELSN